MGERIEEDDWNTLTDNISGKFENYTGMFVLASSGSPSIVNSTLE